MGCARCQLQRAGLLYQRPLNVASGLVCCASASTTGEPTLSTSKAELGTLRRSEANQPVNELAHMGDAKLTSVFPKVDIQPK